jgi:hypothetical protein
MAATRTHFTFRIDMWSADGESIVVDRGQHSEQRSARALDPAPHTWRPHWQVPSGLGRIPQKCRLHTVKANGLWPTPGIPLRQCTAGTRAYLGSFLHVSAIIF